MKVDKVYEIIVEDWWKQQGRILKIILISKLLFERKLFAQISKLFSWTHGFTSIF